MLHLKTARLARWQIRLLAWSGGILWLTGVAWLVLHHYLQHEGEFGPETNPLEPWMLRVHGLALIGALLGVGSLLVVHVWRGWHYRSQRVVGAALLAVTTILVTTGYLLYYASDDWGRGTISAIHWIVGIGSPAIFGWHYVGGRRLGRR